MKDEVLRDMLSVALNQSLCMFLLDCFAVYQRKKKPTCLSIIVRRHRSQTSSDVGHNVQSRSVGT